MAWALNIAFFVASVYAIYHHQYQLALGLGVLAVVFFMAPTNKIQDFKIKTLRIIIFALLIDILAFTIILPLFPRLLAFYDSQDGKNPNSFYSIMKSLVTAFRGKIGITGSRLDIILFGGLVGSLFSFLQFVSSPIIGKLSDSFGRRTILLASMLGNAISMALWVFADSFPIFLMSRIVGGLTEGNVQMSIAMITDITDEESRSKTLSWVGISFALGFTVGPPLGAYLTSIDLSSYFPGLHLNSFSSPAIFAFVLIIIETLYLIVYLPETKNYKTTKRETKGTVEKSKKSKQNPNSLWNLSLIHFVFLFVFSGMEFTLTFLTYDRFQFTNLSQGKLLGTMGVLSALVQGGYVRRVAHKSMSEASLVFQGILACSIGLFVLGYLAVDSQVWLYVGAMFLAFTSGTVVTSLTALASLTRSGDDSGAALGTFRSLGQLGRSLGPIAACTGYWILGSQNVYVLSSILVGIVAIAVKFTLVPVKIKAD